jgi:lysophospholipase L1-like esterase
LDSASRGEVSLLLLLCSALLAFLVAEFLVRWLQPQALVVPWQDEIRGITAPRPEVEGRHFVPGAFDVRISFSAQRFRGAVEYEIQPSDDVLRVVALGDSFTFGYGADDHQAYPARLEGLLNARVPESGRYRRAEVINAGNGGTGTGEQALWFEIWVKKFHPDFVILGVTSNDLDDDMKRGLFYVSAEDEVRPRSLDETARADNRLRRVRRVANAVPGYRYLSQHAHLLALARNAVSHWLAAKRSTRTLSSAPEVQQNTGSPEQWQHIIATFEGEIAWLNRQIKENGARLLLVFIPSRETVYSSNSPWKATVQHRSRLIRDALTRVSNKQSIPYRDLSADVRLSAKSSIAALYYSGLDTHPTPDGYALIASRLFDLLADEL